MRRWLPLAAVAALAIAGALFVIAGGPSSISGSFDEWTQRPRVLTGSDAFESVTVADGASVRQTGELDSDPGDDLAIVEFGNVRLLTPATLAEQARLEMAGDAYSALNPSSRLSRLGDSLVVVNTGGNLRDTGVWNLDGTERWRYRPDADLPATSLVPADLDADNETEFYATFTSYAVRLDAAGQEVWRTPFSVGRIVATAPRTRRDPAWIVAEGQGQTVVWDGSGMRLAGLTMKDARPIGVIDRADGRFLLAGGSAARVIGLDGTVVFNWPVDEMTVVDALPLSLEPGAAPTLAILATNAGSLTRWRLQLVSPDASLLYDEILDTPTKLLKARGADGIDRLFLDGTSLLSLRRRAG